MENDKKAKILLNDGSFKKLIDRVLRKNKIEDFMIDEYFFEELAIKSENFDKALIKSYWNSEGEDFIADGYSRDDIEYEDTDELKEDLILEIITNIAQYYIEKYFDNDMDLLDDMEKYVKQCLK